MARHPAPRDTRPVVHYYPVPDPPALDLGRLADPAMLAAYREQVAEVAARRERDRILYARWKARRAEMAVRDRRRRRVLLMVGVPLTFGLTVGLGVAGWLLWHALAGVNGLAVLVAAALAVAVLGGVGHRCITIVQHWH